MAENIPYVELLVEINTYVVIVDRNSILRNVYFGVRGNDLDRKVAPIEMHEALTSFPL